MLQKEQETLSKQIVQNILTHYTNLQDSSVAIYFPINNEVDLRHLCNICRKTLLPVTNFTNKYIRFALWNDELVMNQYGIYEPKDPVFDLDIDYVFVPMVAFNNNLERIGYGGGFYDKTIAFYREHVRPCPKFIGVAYDNQQAEFTAEEFDQKLDGIFTESRIILKKVLTYKK